MRRKVFSIIAAVLAALMCIPGALAAANGVKSAEDSASKRAKTQLPYEEVPMENIDVTEILVLNIYSGMGSVSFDFQADDGAQRLVKLSCGKANLARDNLNTEKVKDVHELVIGDCGLVFLFADPADGQEDKDFYLDYKKSKDDEYLRLIVFEGDAAIGYALVHYTEVKSGCATYDGAWRPSFGNATIVKAVMLEKDGEPYLELGEADVNALIDETYEEYLASPISTPIDNDRVLEIEAKEERTEGEQFYYDLSRTPYGATFEEKAGLLGLIPDNEPSASSRAEAQLPYEEVPMPEGSIDVVPLASFGSYQGCGIVVFDFDFGSGDPRRVKARCDEFRIDDQWIYPEEDVHTLELSESGSVTLYDAPADDEMDRQHQLYKLNERDAYLRLIIFDGDAAIGYALVHFTNYAKCAIDESGEVGTAMLDNAFLVRAVMFERDGEPYLGVNEDGANALIDRAKADYLNSPFEVTIVDEKVDELYKLSKSGELNEEQQAYWDRYIGSLGPKLMESRDGDAASMEPLPYEEVPMPEESVHVINTRCSGVYCGHGAAALSFESEGSSKIRVQIKCDTYNLVDSEKDWQMMDDDYYEIAGVREIEFENGGCVILYGDPEMYTYPDGSRCMAYVHNASEAYLRSIVFDGDAVVGYALMHFSTTRYEVGEACWGVFDEACIVKAVMFEKDGEPYLGVTEDEVNALLDQAKEEYMINASAEDAEDAETEVPESDEAETEVPETDEAILPESGKVEPTDAPAESAEPTPASTSDVSGRK